MRRAAFVALSWVVGVTLPAFGAYTVEVNSVTGFAGIVGKIAVVPASCPPYVDCVWLNGKVGAELGRRSHIKTVPSRLVAQAMFDAGVEQLTDENRAALAETLGVESFLVVTVDLSEVKQQGAVGVPSGGVIIMVPTEVARGSLDVRVISASDGKVLMKATGFGESEFRAGKGVLGETFARIIEEAFSTRREH